MTEILATIGPASINYLDRMYRFGMSGIRINSSHGDMNSHRNAIIKSRRIKPEAYIVYDIKGPKIRIGDLPDTFRIKSGDRVILRTDIPKAPGSDYPVVNDFEGGIPITYDRFDEYVRAGDMLFVDDGYVGLKVLSVVKGSIECMVSYGDLLRSRKGINHPNTEVEFPYTMPQDIPNLDFSISMGVDFIADSFTRNRDDVEELRGRLEGTGIKIISKIENPQGVDNFDDILETTDAIMIARGDLGVEIDTCELPELQKVMIEKCNRTGKVVITATQMLESMMENPHPSRADVSDIANAIYDGTDVIMLSGETSVGKFPAECILVMNRIADHVEKTARYKEKKKNSNGLSSLL